MFVLHAFCFRARTCSDHSSSHLISSHLVSSHQIFYNRNQPILRSPPIFWLERESDLQVVVTALDCPAANNAMPQRIGPAFPRPVRYVAKSVFPAPSAPGRPYTFSAAIETIAMLMKKETRMGRTGSCRLPVFVYVFVFVFMFCVYDLY